MGLGKLRNRNCIHGCRKIVKTKEGKDLDLGPKKYKDCCWSIDYKEAYYRKPQTGEIRRII